MTPDTAMVLAAGLGTRMRPLTENRPKPLIEIAGRALVDHALDTLAAGGVRRAVVNVHYLADMAEAHLVERRRPDIFISDERDELLETGGGLKKARPLLGDRPVFCTNTDQVFLDGPGGPAALRVARRWDETRMSALLLLQPVDNAPGYDGVGDFDLDAEGRLQRRGDAPSAPYVFTGLQIIDPALLDDAPDGPFSTRLLWEKALAAGRLYGMVHDGGWMHVGTPEGLQEAERRLAGHGNDMRRSAL